MKTSANSYYDVGMQFLFQLFIIILTGNFRDFVYTGVTNIIPF